MIGRRRNGITGAIFVFLLPIAALVFSLWIPGQCEGNDCEPLRPASVWDEQKLHNADAIMTGVANQMLYAVEVDGRTLKEAIKLYSYCEVGPADRAVAECEDVPEKSDITDAIDGYEPWMPPQGNVSWSETAVQVGVIAYDETVLEAGQAPDEGAGFGSTIAETVVLPGGEHAEVWFEMEHGAVKTGTTTGDGPIE